MNILKLQKISYGGILSGCDLLASKPGGINGPVLMAPFAFLLGRVAGFQDNGFGGVNGDRHRNPEIQKTPERQELEKK